MPSTSVPPVEFVHIFTPAPKVALQACSGFEQPPIPEQVELHTPLNVQSDRHVPVHDPQSSGQVAHVSPREEAQL